MCFNEAISSVLNFRPVCELMGRLEDLGGYFHYGKLLCTLPGSDVHMFDSQAEEMIWLCLEKACWFTVIFPMKRRSLGVPKSGTHQCSVSDSTFRDLLMSDPKKL